MLPQLATLLEAQHTDGAAPAFVGALLGALAGQLVQSGQPAPQATEQQVLLLQQQIALLQQQNAQLAEALRQLLQQRTPPPATLARR